MGDCRGWEQPSCLNIRMKLTSESSARPFNSLLLRRRSLSLLVLDATYWVPYVCAYSRVETARGICFIFSFKIHEWMGYRSMGMGSCVNQSYVVWAHQHMHTRLFLFLFWCALINFIMHRTYLTARKFCSLWLCESLRTAGDTDTSATSPFRPTRSRLVSKVSYRYSISRIWDTPRCYFGLERVLFIDRHVPNVPALQSIRTKSNAGWLTDLLSAVSFT